MKIKRKRNWKIADSTNKSLSSAAEMLTFLQTYTKEREKAEEKKLSFLGEMKDKKKQYFSQFLKTLKNKRWRDLTKKSSFYADQSLDLLVFFPKNIYPKKGGKAREQKLNLLREMKDKKSSF